MRAESNGADLRAAHPDPLGADASGLAGWAARDGNAEEGVPAGEEGGAELMLKEGIWDERKPEAVVEGGDAGGEAGVLGRNRVDRALRPLRVVVAAGAPGREAQLVAEMVVLARPDQQATAVGGLPPEALLRAVEGVAAVMGVDAGEEILHAGVQQCRAGTPGVAVDVGGHGRAERQARAEADRWLRPA